MTTENLLQEARELEEICVRDRRALHSRAETGFELYETCRYIRSQLEAAGIQPRSCGRCGITAAIGTPGKTVLLRADMDALPIREETGLPHACTAGNMHGCGHDMHAAMLLAAARILKSHEDELRGTVKLMFQPAEEILEGAKDMIGAGVLEHPKVDAALMLHVITAQPIPTGTLVIPAPGVSAPAAGTFRIRIRGKGAHGAMPHTGRDPLNAAAHIVTALQEINARELAPGENAVLTVGSLQAGSTPNVIPDTALLEGSFRAFSDESFQLIRRRVEEIGRGIAEVFRTEAEVEFPSECPALLINADLAGHAQRCLSGLLGADKVLNAAGLNGSGSRFSGSEDFAFVSHRVPSLMLALAAGRPEDGYVHPLHHPKADFDERALIHGAAAYACFAMKWLEEHGSAL